MAIPVIQAIRKMRGGSQSQLMLGADDNLWIVKFQNNPQHPRVLVNEWIGTHLGAAIGLTVPVCEVMDVPPYLVENSAEMYYELCQGRIERYEPGLQFGSKFVGGLLVYDYLPDQQLSEASNLDEFAGVLCLDKWGSNSDGRQAVFNRKLKKDRYQATFIDQGFYFNAGEWNFPDAPLRGVYGRRRVYAKVTGWDSFEPWLHRIEDMKPDELWRIAETVPPEWYEGQSSQLERLMERMVSRRSRVRELLLSFRDSDAAPFPLWHTTSTVSVP